ncbi:hypothetical protein CS022_17875 [Veronia nyctiphanis]|uniref:CN hydrolase domain-containing protein n=1 Tax=Veronia nyctiphanis TaxID=1278244 RepID=A0A4Q0YNV7_9GAMM|nr:carbon-nitrogen hydrolase family protein [Veronia nyctiphanis]RXJ72135.1 hypothetical protein CS022_17875 [Veronia nyctiphanis]
MKLGIVQMPMAWTSEENTKVMCDVLNQHSYLDIVLFPELSISGFHRNIREEIKADKISEAVRQIANACRASKIAAFVGSPTINNGLYYNSYLAFDEKGEVVAHWHKAGLTPSESEVFEPGRFSVVNKICGLACTALICREANDSSWFINECQPDLPDIVIWPCYVGNLSNDSDDTGFNDGVSRIAKNLSAYLFQTNWPVSLNQPEATGLGGSKVFSPKGAILAQLPIDKTCIGIFDLDTHFLSVEPLNLSIDAIQ